MINYLMPAHWFVGLRKKEESQKMHVGVQRRGRRFWLKGHQAKPSISGPYQHIHTSCEGGLCPVMMGVRTVDRV